MNESMTIGVSTMGAAVGIVGVLGMMLRILATNIAKQFDSVDRRLDELKTDMRSQFGETNSPPQRIETRIDDTNKRTDAVGRDIAELRDRTGALEGSVGRFEMKMR